MHIEFSFSFVVITSVSNAAFTPTLGNLLILKFSSWRPFASISRAGKSKLPERVNLRYG
jgi:hypothetical protein